MGRPAAKKGDVMFAIDIHIVMIPTPFGTIPVPLPNPFKGKIEKAVSPNVKIMGKPAVTQLSTAQNKPPHIPIGGPFQKPPSNRGFVFLGSFTVRINMKMAGRSMDLCMTCNDPVDLPIGFVQVKGKSTVKIGG